MRRAVGMLIFALAVTLAACTASPESTPSAESASSHSKPPTVSPSPSPGTEPVLIKDYATQIDFRGSGVDFDSADGNIHCGIWDAYEYYRPGSTTSTPVNYSGCRPAVANYKTQPSADPSGNVGCTGGEMNGALPPEPVCNNGQVFVGEAPTIGPVGLLMPGRSISFAGFTCVAPDSGTIACSRDADGAGFRIGRDSYSYF